MRHKQLFSALVALTALVAGPSGVDAQERRDPTVLSLEDLMATPVDEVHGASKFLQKITDAPASITVVTADDIRLYGYRTLADVLRSVEGISIAHDRNYTYVGMRGLSRTGDLNSRVLVLVDGHRMNNNVDDQGLIGTAFQVDVDLIDRVEVIRGPSAAVYGSTAFSAVIAVVTKRGREFDGFETAASAASYGTGQARATWGRRYASGLELLVSGSRRRSEGVGRLFFPEFAAGDSGGYAGSSDSDGNDSVALSASGGDFTFHGLYSGRRKQVPTASFGTVFNSGRERTFDGRAAVDLQYTSEFGRSTKLLARTFADRSTYDGDYPYAGDPDEEGADLLMNRDQFRGLWWGTELDISHRMRRSHNLTVGTEFRRNVQQSLLNYDEEPRVVYIDERPQTYTLAVNLQDEYTINRHLLLNVAGRGERIATGDTGFTPKVGLIVTPTDPGPTVKLLFSRALRAPSAYELHYDSPANAGNRGLKPERTQSLEAEIAQPLGSSMTVQGSLFRNTYRDLVVDTSDASGQVVLQNGLNAEATGLNVSWSLSPRRGVRARASYSTQFEGDATSQAWTSSAPRHLAKVNVATPVAPLGFTAGFEMQYESTRHTYLDEALAPALVANMSVTRSRLLAGLDLRVSIFNLFDERYREPVSANHRQGAIDQDGRQLFVGLTWRAP
jgi:outer membrane receptor protein involved in Fe transport